MIDKNDNLTGEEILHTQQHRIIEKANLTTSPLKKELEKQVNTIEDKGEKQNEAIEKQSVVSCKNTKMTILMSIIGPIKMILNYFWKKKISHEIYDRRI